MKTPKEVYNRDFKITKEDPPNQWNLIEKFGYMVFVDLGASPNRYDTE